MAENEAKYSNLVITCKFHDDDVTINQSIWCCFTH